jgi:hypothetical protein
MKVEIRIEDGGGNPVYEEVETVQEACRIAEDLIEEWYGDPESTEWIDYSIYRNNDEEKSVLVSLEATIKSFENRTGEEERDGNFWDTLHHLRLAHDYLFDYVQNRLGVIESGTVTLNPKEPECTNENKHRWETPYELVGGIEENPGVWGSGGGVIIKEVCIHCGCVRNTDTWAQRMSDGQQGLRSISYEEGAYDDDELERIRTDYI